MPRFLDPFPSHVPAGKVCLGMHALLDSYAPVLALATEGLPPPPLFA